MKGSHYSRQRKNRIQDVQNYIQEQEPISRKKVRSETVINYGVTPDKAEEYIQVLIDAEKVVENDDNQLEYNGD